MRVLFTNNTLDQPAGTELSVFDYAVSLRKRGNEVAAFSRQHGEIARRLESAGVSVLDDLNALSWEPDVIHGHHQWETTLAALRFPDRPVISFCRGTLPWQEAPCLAPNVVRHVGVDSPCCELLKTRWGIVTERVSLLSNGVDLERFPERSEPLPEVPDRALVFSNYAKEDNFFAVIREACDRRGVACQGLGVGLKNAVSDPVPALAGADLVFAKGKAALEAMVSGCGVIVCDESGVGPFVTPDCFDFARSQSFAYAAMTDPVTVETVLARLDQWDAGLASETAGMARRVASVEKTVDGLEELYRRSIEDWARLERPEPAAYWRFTANFVSEATIAYKLGREMRSLWRRENPDDRSSTETVEMNRILYAMREAESRVAKLRRKVEERELKVKMLREKLDIAKAEGRKKKRRWFGGG